MRLTAHRKQSSNAIVPTGMANPRNFIIATRRYNLLRNSGKRKLEKTHYLSLSKFPWKISSDERTEKQEKKN